MRPAPDPSTLAIQSIRTLQITGTQAVTLNPGVYIGGIQISDQARVTQNPGIYYLKGEGLAVSGQATLADRGQGVMIYNAPGSAGGVISLTAQGSVSLSPPKSGIYRGITIFQDGTCVATISITGNGRTTITGTIYAAAAHLFITGNGGLNVDGSPLDTIGSLLIADDLTITGNATFVVGLDP